MLNVLNLNTQSLELKAKTSNVQTHKESLY
jgi:hypothetical protein